MYSAHRQGLNRLLLRCGRRACNNATHAASGALSESEGQPDWGEIMTNRNDNEYRSDTLGHLGEITRTSRRQVLKGTGATVAIALAPGLIGTASAQAGSSIVAAFSRDFGSFDPHLATTATSIAVNAHVLEPLIDNSFVTREFGLGLAAELPEQLDDTHYRVRIRPGATFHDGSPVTAEDVIFSYERVLDPDTNSFFRQFVDFIEKVEAVDDSTVDFTVKYPVGLFTERLVVVKIVPKAAFEAAGAEQFGLQPMGSGPYTFVEALNNNRVILKRFADYNGPTPGSIEDIDFRIQLDGPSRVSSLRAGQTQVIEDPSDRDMDVLRNSEGIEVASLPSFTMQFLMFNCSRPEFADRRVRQALHWAIDRETMTRAAFLGNASEAISYLPALHSNHIVPDQVYSRDVERAKSLLAEAGYGDGLSFTLQVFESVWVETSAAILQQNWRDIGVEIDLLVGGESIYANVFDASYQAQLALADQSLFGWDAGTLLGWHYGATWAEQLYFWEAPEKDQMLSLLEEAFKASGQEQFDLYAQIQNLAAVEVPIAALHHRYTNTAWSSEALASFDPIRTLGLDLRSAVANT